MSRKLPSEKSDNKKFTFFQRFFSNNFTHYNYYFYTHEMIKEIIETAQAQWRDDYSALLPFYNYDLATTAQQTNLLEDVIYTANAGILLHDLRNNWVDKMYLLLGEAYLLKKDLDSSIDIFSYMNYAFAPKPNGLSMPIGSRFATVNGKFTLSSPENKKSIARIFGRLPPSRNESFLWLARTYIEKNDMGSSIALLENINTDSLFPKRLHTHLYEILAYWHYKNKHWEKAADYLSLALPHAPNHLAKVRWIYLIGQLYALSKKDEKAVRYFEIASRRADNHIMSIYADINALKLSNTHNARRNFYQSNINQLRKLAKDSRNKDYRSAIYYSIARLELERTNYSEVQKNLRLSGLYATPQSADKGRAFKELGDIYVRESKFIDALSAYDSIPTNYLVGLPDSALIKNRQKYLRDIVKNNDIIYKQDSLQKLASLPENILHDRLLEFIKDAKKKLNKRERDSIENLINPNVQLGDNFSFLSDTIQNGNGLFYFNNPTVRNEGVKTFNKIWGTKKANDYWAITAKEQAQFDQLNIQNSRFIKAANINKQNEPVVKSKIPTVDELLQTLPLTNNSLKESNTMMEDAFYNNGVLLTTYLDDYPTAIINFEQLLKRYAETPRKPEVLFYLSYLYQKVGNNYALQETKKELLKNYSQTDWGKKFQAAQQGIDYRDSSQQINDVYEKIYDHFIEGNFEVAFQEQNEQHDLFNRKNKWVEQLLFIESVYYISRGRDSVGIRTLEKIINNYPKSGLVDRAETLIALLRKKKSVEDAVKKIEVPDVLPENYFAKKADLYTPRVVTLLKKDSVLHISQEPKMRKYLTNIKLLNNAQYESFKVGPYYINPLDTERIVIVLNKVDALFINEVRNSIIIYNTTQNNKSTRYACRIYNINNNLSFISIDSFAGLGTAMDYYKKLKKALPNSLITWLEPSKYDLFVINRPCFDSLLRRQDVNNYRQVFDSTLQKLFAIPKGDDYE
ncbi:MAG: hypothetical protein QM528_05960 [Phycisphaerales bacterium]|nr:hypothetical protein [Phycisphaerales bacterium]